VGHNEPVEVETPPPREFVSPPLKEEPGMNRKVVLFSLSVIFILAFSNLQGAVFDDSNVNLDPRQIDGGELAAVPPVEDTIRFFQARIQANPQDAVSYTLLAEQYIRQAREKGDASSYQYAEEALHESVRLLPNYALAKTALASVYYSQHDFVSALDLAQQVHEKNAKNLDALAVMGDAQLALGNYQEADLAYQKLSEQSATPPVLARLAAFEELKGNPGQALDLMRSAASTALQSGGTRESVAWYVLRMGDLYFNMGEPKQAGRYYQAALRIFENYHLALAGLGKVHAARGDYEEAILYYQQAVAKVPEPDLLAALGDLYTLTGQHGQAEVQYRTVEYIGKLAELNKQIYNRQLANFYSDHDLRLKEALRLAQAELQTRKDIYGYDAAAWAEYKNGNFAEAQRLIQQAMTLGTRDARLYYHAGMIALELGEDAQAREYLEQAVEINPYFSILHAEEARTILETLKD
jgi:tetratricopeptide (TPR) repeat protein